MTSPTRKNKRSPTKSVESYDQEKSPTISLNKQTLQESLTELESFTDLLVPDEIDFIRTPSQTSTLCSKSCHPVRSYTRVGCSGDAYATKSGVKSLSEKDFPLSRESFARESFCKPVIATNKVIHIDIAPANEFNVEDVDTNKEKLLYIHEIQVFRDKVSVENTSNIEIIEPKKKLKAVRVKGECSFLSTEHGPGNKNNTRRPTGLSIECSQSHCYPSGSFDTVDRRTFKYRHKSKIPQLCRKTKSSYTVPTHSKKVIVPTSTAESFVQTDSPTVNRRRSTLKTGFLRVFVSFARCFM